MTTWRITIEIEADTKDQAEAMVDEIGYWVSTINNGGDLEAHATLMDDLEEIPT